MQTLSAAECPRAPPQVGVAIARELRAFLGAIAQEVPLTP